MTLLGLGLSAIITAVPASAFASQDRLGLALDVKADVNARLLGEDRVNGNFYAEGRTESKGRTDVRLDSNIRVNSEDDRKSDKKDDRDDDKDDKNYTRASSTRSDDGRVCWKAWGNLIAPAWIKLNASTTLSDGCFMPFGIGKKFWGNGTTTPDVTAPVITDISIKAGEESARISWETNEKSNSAVFYGTTTPVSMSTSSPHMIIRTDMDRDHEINLSRLNASTTYYAVIVSRDRSGNTATSGVQTFSTKPSDPDTQAPSIRSLVSTVGTSTVAVGWYTNELTTAKLFYGTSSPIDVSASTTASVALDATLSTHHLFSLTGLATSTTYRAVAQSSDASGNVKTSSEFSFTTSSGQ
jgi:hypothetical protein